MSRGLRIVAGVTLAGLVGAGIAAYRAAAAWRETVPWPAQAGPAWPGTATLRAAHEAAVRWPVRRDAVERLARLYLANGFNAEAAVLLPGIVARRPDAPEWVHRRAVLLAESGRLEAAAALWQGLRPVTGHRPVRLRLADALVKLNREAEAAAIYREVLAAEPGEPYAWHGLVRLDVRAGRWTEARDKLRHALAARPDFYGHHALRATVARQLGDAADAAAADREVKRLGRFRDLADPWMEPALGDCFDAYRLRVDADRLRGDAEISGGGIAPALARLERAIALEPGNALNFQLLATLHGVSGDEAAAERAYQRGLELDPRAVTIYLRYANLLERRGRGPELRALLATAARHCPQDADIAARLGEACAQAGQWAEAARHLGRLVALRPDRPELGPRAALASFRAGDEAGGLAVLHDNLRRHPGHEETLGYLLMDACRRGVRDEATELLRRLEAVAPDASATRRLQELVRARFGG